MFAEKSTELIRRTRRAALANKKALIVKWAGDDRYNAGPVVITHSGEVRQSTSDSTKHMESIRVVTADKLADVDVGDAEVIGIDEGQFYPDLAIFCEKWANDGRDVVVAALSGTFERKPFPSGQLACLIPLCESVKTLHGICMVCRRRKSSFSKRISSSREVLLIGEKNDYLTTCRKCYGMDISPGALTSLKVEQTAKLRAKPVSESSLEPKAGQEAMGENTV